MPEIGAYEAKTHLPRLLGRVQKGERFIITKHGKPIAEIVPVSQRDEEAVKRAIASLRSIRRRLARRGVTLHRLARKGESLRNLAHEGHRY